MTLLEVEDLRVEFGTKHSPLVAVEKVSFTVAPGEVVGLVGESGSGKSLTSRAIMRLISPPGRITGGRIVFDGQDVLAMSRKQLRAFRARDIGMIFQDPFTSLNPVLSVGEQLSETLRVNVHLAGKTARRVAVDMLDRVGIPDPDRHYRSYPHELSGGMRQRIMIALATAAKPRLLLADEPTTALDVLTQKQVLSLLAKMRRELGMAILLVSHDFGVIAQMCDREIVMYGGRVVETGPVDAVFRRPQHPYTRALLGSVPDLDEGRPKHRRAPLQGQPPGLGKIMSGCVFASRCPHVRDECRNISMSLRTVDPGHQTACPFETTSSEHQNQIAT